MWPPTQSIATVPTAESVESSLGIPATRPRPTVCPTRDAVWVRCRPTSSILTMTATTPYTAAVRTKATTMRMMSRGTNAWSATSLRAITMISADKIKSVRIAPVTMCVLGDRRGMGVMTADAAPHLLGAFVTQIRGTEHQNRDHQPRRELTEQHCGGQDQQELVAQRSHRDALDDRQLALGSDPVDVLRCHRGVVNHHSGSLGGRATTWRRPVVREPRRRPEVRKDPHSSRFRHSAVWPMVKPRGKSHWLIVGSERADHRKLALPTLSGSLHDPLRSPVVDPRASWRQVDRRAVTACFGLASIERNGGFRKVVVSATYGGGS